MRSNATVSSSDVARSFAGLLTELGPTALDRLWFGVSPDGSDALFSSGLDPETVPIGG